MISEQLTRGTPPKASHVPELPAEVLLFGVNMLRLAVAFDKLRMRGASHEQALLQLRHRPQDFLPELIDALADMKSEEAKMELRKIPIATLTIGMILQQDVKNRSGLLIVSKGQEITRPLLLRLKTFSSAHLIDNEVTALVPM